MGGPPTPAARHSQRWLSTISTVSVKVAGQRRLSTVAKVASQRWPTPHVKGHPGVSPGAPGPNGVADGQEIRKNPLPIRGDVTSGQPPRRASPKTKRVMKTQPDKASSNPPGAGGHGLETFRFLLNQTLPGSHDSCRHSGSPRIRPGTYSYSG